MHVNNDPVYVRRRIVAVAVVLVALVAVFVGGAALVRAVGGTDPGADASPAAASTTSPADASSTSSDDSSGESSDSPSTTSTTTDPTKVYYAMSPEVPAPEPSPGAQQGTKGPAGKTEMVRIQRIASDTLSPKSIVASDDLGILFAQNMMYHHTISVFRSDGALLKTIPDSVKLSGYGITGHPGTSQGAPVEMAFSPDGTHAWVSNYSMYGSGFGPEGLDSCSPGDGTDTSYVYRVDTHSLEIDDAIHVGAVPKYVAATPDGSTVLVSNWCTWDLSVIDTATGKEVKRVPLGGAYPRGIVVSPDSRTAYVALMGSARIVEVDLNSYRVSTFASPGNGPRHLVISPDGKYVYSTNNASGTVTKMDRRTGRILDSVATGSQPRSMAISSDGQALYVVNYDSNTVSKVRTSSMTIMESDPTDYHPIGITYEPHKKRVWVACYGGSVLVFDDSRRPVA